MVVPRDKDMLYYEAGCGFAVYVRKHDPKSIFHDKTRPYGAWFSGCAVGYSKTLKQAINVAHAYLLERIGKERLSALGALKLTDRFLAKHTQPVKMTQPKPVDVPKEEGVEPVDLLQCQVLVPNGCTFMSFGGRPGCARCTNEPIAVLTEKKPGKGGKRGSMSVCGSCLIVACKQMDLRKYEVKAIQHEQL